MFPLNLQKKTNKAEAIDDEMIPVSNFFGHDDEMIPVSNFFGHWFTDIDVRQYPDDMLILSTNNSVSIVNYSNAQMKYLSEKSVKKLAKTMLYCNKAVYLDGNDNRILHNSATAADRTDLNLTKRIKLFKDCIFWKNVYRIPLILLCDLGKCNFSSKTDKRIIITLKRNLNKLFESNEKVANILTDLDTLIQIYARTYISY